MKTHPGACGPGTAALVLVISALFGGCAVVGRVHPGSGSRTTITGFSYQAIWEAALRAAKGRFEVLESDRAHGIIRADHSTGILAGHRIAVFITPSVDAPEYTVEVVAEGKLRSRTPGLGWERQVLQDVVFTLNHPGKPLPKDPAKGHGYRKHG
jgi:hypothetical protein